MNMKVDKKFIVNIQGTDAVTYEGLLNLFHENGGESISTRMSTHSTAECPIFHAKVKGERGEFSGYGDASRANVNSKIAQHMIRMAETRAKARALRDYCNIGMVAAEELGEGDVVTPENDVVAARNHKVKETTGEKLDASDSGYRENRKPTEKQLNYMNGLIVASGVLPDVFLEERGIDPVQITMKQASDIIEELKG